MTNTFSTPKSYKVKYKLLSHLAIHIIKNCSQTRDSYIFKNYSHTYRHLYLSQYKKKEKNMEMK